MTSKSVTCIQIECDICGTEYDLEGEGYTQHFHDLPGAVKYLADDEWKVQPDGYAVCPASDEEHDAARAALAPKPPELQVVGQHELTCPAWCTGHTSAAGSAVSA